MFSKRVQIFIFIVSNSEAWPRGDEVGMEKWNKVKWPQILFLLHCTLKLKSSIGVKEKQSKTKYTEIICRRDDKIKNSELWDWVGTHRQKERTFHFSLRTHKTHLLAHSQQPRGRESFLVWPWIHWFCFKTTPPCQSIMHMTFMYHKPEKKNYLLPNSHKSRRL